MVLDGSDNFPTKYLVSDACTILGIPNVYGAILGFEGQVSVFSYNRGPSYRLCFQLSLSIFYALNTVTDLYVGGVR